MITLKDLRKAKIISPQKAIIKKAMRKIDKMRKKKTKTGIPRGAFDRIKIVDYTNTEDFKLGKKL